MFLRSALIAALWLWAVALAEARRPDSTSGQLGRLTKRGRTNPRSNGQQYLRAENSTSTTNYQFYNNVTSQYLVKSLALFPKLPEIYSGSIPINAANASEGSFFFVFQPTIGEPVDDLTIWLNGGPGCSSLGGFLQENGPFVWQPGMIAPARNPWSWSNITNMLWVEYPKGTGFSQGPVTATTEEEIAQDFIRWLQNFEREFRLPQMKIHMTGESYAGRYVPYIADAMLNENDTKHFDLHSVVMFSPTIGSSLGVGRMVNMFPLMEKNLNYANLNSTFMAQMKELHEQCGYAQYIDKFLHFPPSGVQPPFFFNFSDDKALQCDIHDIMTDAILINNPCYDFYAMNLQCPLAYDPLGFGVLEQPAANVQPYFDRADVKAAMHAPAHVTWADCSVAPVFAGGTGGPELAGDFSLDPAQSVLPSVIERIGRVLISTGDLDTVIPTNGTLLMIQNMTWNGQLGFQNQPNTTFEVTLPDISSTGLALEALGFDNFTSTPQGVMGVQASRAFLYLTLMIPNFPFVMFMTFVLPRPPSSALLHTHTERNLTFVEVFESGHEVPQYQSRAAFLMLQWALRRIDSLPTGP